MTPRDRAAARRADYSRREAVTDAKIEALEAVAEACAARCWDDANRAARSLEAAAAVLRESWTRCVMDDIDSSDAQREDAADAARKGEA